MALIRTDVRVTLTRRRVEQGTTGRRSEVGVSVRAGRIAIRGARSHSAAAVRIAAVIRASAVGRVRCGRA